MSRLKSFALLARPHQHLKNAFILLPLLFGYKLNDLRAILQAFAAFLIFSLAAGSVYAFNDCQDVEADRRHPIKKERPLASGALTVRAALLFSAVLLICSVVASISCFGPDMLIVLGAYVLLNFAYSIGLKHLAIVDVVCIGTGFVLRIFAGGIAAQVRISHWLILMTFLVALFLAFAKRRDDLLLQELGMVTRRSLDGYSLEFVSQSMVLMAAVIVVSYILYTLSPEVIAKHGTTRLYLTAIWVIIGVLRYLQVTFVQQKSGAPTLVLMKDHFLQVVIGLWILSIYVILYGPWRLNEGVMG